MISFRPIWLPVAWAALSCTACSELSPTPADFHGRRAVSIIRLDAVTSTDVADVFVADVAADVRAWAATHDVAPISAARHDQAAPAILRDVIAGVSARAQVETLDADALIAEIADWAEALAARVLEGAGDDAFPTPSIRAHFDAAERRARAERALARADELGGPSLRNVRSSWAEVEATESASTWLNPVRVEGDPTCEDARDALELREDLRLIAWDEGALETFHDAVGPRFDALVPLLDPRSDVDARWLFGATDTTALALVVHDTHGRLWGFTAPRRVGR